MPPVCLTAPICLNTSCMFGCPNMCGHPHMFGHHPYVWMHPVCLDTPCMFGWCLDAPCTYKTQRKHALSHQRVSICPIHLDPPYVWMASCMFECPICVDTPVYLDAPYVWMLLICLDTPCMFGCPHTFGHPMYVWMMFGYTPYIHNTKKACFVILRECPYIPIHLDAPCMFQCTSCLDTPHMFECPHIFEHPAVCLGDVWMPMYIHNT